MTSRKSSPRFRGTKYCVGVANGTDAVRFALMASGVGKGDAVVTVSHTFIATTEAISQSGAETEFVDIDERTYCMSPVALATYLMSCAQGQPDRAADRTPDRQSRSRPSSRFTSTARSRTWTRCRRSRSEYGLLIVEDACQAQGADITHRTAAGRRAGSFGKAGAFSFYPGKNLGACGEAGAVTTDDEQVAKTIKMLREHGQITKYYHDLEGYNGRLDAIQAAFLRIKLRRLGELERSAAGRRGALQLAARRRARASSCRIEPSNSKAIYHLYVIRTKDREALGRAAEGRRHPHRPALSAAGAPAELLQVVGLPARVAAGYRARGERDPVAADVPGPDEGAAGARRRGRRHVPRRHQPAYRTLINSAGGPAARGAAGPAFWSSRSLR